MEAIDIATRSRTECVDITGRVQEVVTQKGVASGVVITCSAHTTAGVTVNENADPDVMADVLATLSRLVPRQGSYAHGEGNSDAHIKATLVGLSVTLPIENGRLVLGTWQGLYFLEFDGPRRRRVMVQVLDSASETRR